MSNFDTTEYMWYMNYNLRFIFTNEFEEDGRHWACDSWDNCVYLDVETQQLCDWNLDCYAPEEYYEAYFSFDDDTYTDVVSDLIGEVWGSGLGWCQSDLDEEAEAYSIEECWTACINNFGDSILAVDYNPNDGCYCQSSCDCLTEVGDEDIVLMVSEHLWNLPEICEGEEWNFREELFIEFAYQMQDSLASQDLYYDSEEEFYAELMPIFEEKWEELGVNEDTEDWQGTWDLLWAPVMDEFGVNLENWNYGADFDWEDWRSNFDMEEDRWYEHYDMSVIFPSPWNHEGIEYVCDFDDNCWYFNYDLQEACDMDGNCYTPEEALRVYFEGDLENWNYGADFDWRIGAPTSIWKRTDGTSITTWPLFSLTHGTTKASSMSAMRTTNAGTLTMNPEKLAISKATATLPRWLLRSTLKVSKRTGTGVMILTGPIGDQISI
jgi:hypothetical protein